MDEDTKEKVYEKIGRYEGLNIKRVPLTTLSIFKEFARLEFCDDYGMALKYLVDIVFSEIPRSIEELNNRVLFLETGKTKEIRFKTNSGRVIEEVKK